MTDVPSGSLGVLIAKMDALTEKVDEARDELKNTGRELARVKDQLILTSYDLAQTKTQLESTQKEVTAAKGEVENLKKMLSHYRGGVVAILGIGGLIGWVLATISGISGVIKSWSH